MIRLGVIGMGARGVGLTGLLLQTDPEVRLTAVADVNESSARQKLSERGIDAAGTTFHQSVDDLLSRADELDGLVISTRCNLHTPIAVRCAATRLPLYLEKPIAVDDQQVAQLTDAFAPGQKRVLVSFPLRASPLFMKVDEVVRSGRLGTINQVQAVNYVPYGGIYFGQWYRDFDTTRGMWLQKATHDLDYINHLIAAEPTRVAAIGSHRIYGGTQPEGTTCSRCDVVSSCPEGPPAIAARGNDGGMGKGDHACAFGVDIKHHDAGSAIIAYDNGIQASYAQNFVTRRSAAARGARITGYHATLHFDWYTETITIIEHMGTGVEQQRVTVTQGHHGGDHRLARNFIEMIRDGAEPLSTLEEGLRSARLCLAAQKSEESQSFEVVPGMQSYSRK